VKKYSIRLIQAIQRMLTRVHVGWGLVLRWLRNFADWARVYKDAFTVIGVGVGLVGLFLLISQTHSLDKQTQILSQQSQMLSAQYEASYRPYLRVEDITTQEGNNSFIEILITIKNYGQVPATKVNLQKVIIGGADVIYDEKTGTYTFIYMGDGNENESEPTTENQGGVTITTSEDYIMALVETDYPPDFIFYPGSPQTVVASVHRPTYQATVSENGLMHIALEYSWGLKQYYYVAKAILQDNTWNVTENRGN